MTANQTELTVRWGHHSRQFNKSYHIFQIAPFNCNRQHEPTLICSPFSLVPHFGADVGMKGVFSWKNFRKKKSRTTLQERPLKFQKGSHSCTVESLMRPSEAQNSCSFKVDRKFLNELQQICQSQIRRTWIIFSAQASVFLLMISGVIVFECSSAYDNDWIHTMKGAKTSVHSEKILSQCTLIDAEQLQNQNPSSLDVRSITLSKIFEAQFFFFWTIWSWVKCHFVQLVKVLLTICLLFACWKGGAGRTFQSDTSEGDEAVTRLEEIDPVCAKH